MFAEGRRGTNASTIERRFESPALLLFNFFDLAALASADLPEQRRPAVKNELGYGDDMGGGLFGAADVEATGNAAIVTEVQYIDHLTSCRDWYLGRFWYQETLKLFAEPSVDRQCPLELRDENIGLVRAIDRFVFLVPGSEKPSWAIRPFINRTQGPGEK